MDYGAYSRRSARLRTISSRRQIQSTPWYVKTISTEIGYKGNNFYFKYNLFIVKNSENGLLLPVFDGLP